MPAWFFHHPLPDAGTVVLDAAEARHASGARRLRTGDAVCLFDGSGRVADGDIISADRDDVRVSVNHVRAQPAPRPAIHLLCALPKGDRLATLLDMATQLGMSSFTPVMTRNSVVDPGDAKPPRWQRICIEACKQSRRAHLPVLHAAVDWSKRTPLSRGQLLVLDPSGRPFHEWLSTYDGCSAVSVAIGPEGGFAADELPAEGTPSAFTLSLGPGILRIETAAVAVLATFRLASSSSVE